MGETWIPEGQGGRYFVLVCFLVIKHWPKPTWWWGHWFIWLRPPNHRPSLRETRAQTREGTWRQVLKQRSWSMLLTGLFPRAYSACFVVRLFFNTTQNHLLMDGTAHNGLGPSTPSIRQENAPQSCLQANLTEEATSQLRLFLLPRWFKPSLIDWKTKQKRTRPLVNLMHKHVTIKL